MVRRNSRSTQFREAALPALERVRRDRERVSDRAVPILAFIEEWLFDVDLDLRLSRQIEALPQYVVQEFCVELGLRPLEYVRERRVDVAERLLRTTRWPVYQVAAELGFRNTKQLQYAFKTRTGRSPSEVRPEPSEADEPRKSGRDPKHSALLEVQGVIGALEPQAMVALVQRLRSLAPSMKRREPSRPLFELSMPGYERERELAESVWRAAGALPTRHLRHLLCRRLRFQSPALFRLLGEKGREIGRRDRKRGVAMVGLGVEVLEANAEAFGESVHDLLTVGWSWTSNQRRLQLDWPGSEEALGFARQEWETPRASRDPLAEAEFRFWEGTLRLYQRRFDEALEALNRAIELSRGSTNRELFVQSLVQRTELSRHIDDPESAAKDLREASEYIKVQENPFLMLSIYTNLIALYMRLGRLEETSGVFRKAEDLSRAIDNRLVEAQLLWLKGLVLKRRSEIDSAESLLREAYDLLVEQNEMAHASVAALDLMELYIDSGRASVARDLVYQTISILESLKLHRETLTAIKLLRSAAETGVLNLTVIESVRSKLRYLKRDAIDGSYDK